MNQSCTTTCDDTGDLAMRVWTGGQFRFAARPSVARIHVAHVPSDSLGCVKVRAGPSVHRRPRAGR